MMKQLVRGLKSLFAGAEPKRRERPHSKNVRLCRERLEDRDCPSTFTVINLNDAGVGQITNPDTGDGQGDFRYCLTQANQHPGQDTIWSNVAGQVNLGQELPHVSDSVDIWGNGLGLARNAMANFRVLTIDRGPGQVPNMVNIHDLSISNGNVIVTAAGGGIRVDGATVTLTFCHIFNNSAGQGGGVSISRSEAHACRRASPPKFPRNSAGRWTH